MSNKIKSDDELKHFLKENNINILNIIHKYEPNERCASYACVSCDYVTLRCWLCDQCISCCSYNVSLIEDKEN
jgi:hypothetical protein